MKKHIEIYKSFWNPELTISQTYQCCWCDSWEGGEIHHIEKRGMGGSKCQDRIENLVYLCRTHHQIADNKTAFELLKDTESSIESQVFEDLRKTENSTSAKALVKKDERIKDHYKEKNKALNKYLKSQIVYQAKIKLDDLEQTQEVNKRHEMKLSGMQI